MVAGRVTHRARPRRRSPARLRNWMAQDVKDARLVGADDFDSIRELGQQLRGDGIRASTAAGSGHPTSSMSAAALIAALLARHLRCDWVQPNLPTNDHRSVCK